MGGGAFYGFIPATMLLRKILTEYRWMGFCAAIYDFNPILSH
jgi:hypothetical protein